jgi:hypothetical protein
MNFVFETVLFWVNDAIFATVCYFVMRSGTKKDFETECWLYLAARKLTTKNKYNYSNVLI